MGVIRNEEVCPCKLDHAIAEAYEGHIPESVSCTDAMTNFGNEKPSLTQAHNNSIIQHGHTRENSAGNK